MSHVCSIDVCDDCLLTIVGMPIDDVAAHVKSVASGVADSHVMPSVVSVEFASKDGKYFTIGMPLITSFIKLKRLSRGVVFEVRVFFDEVVEPYFMVALAKDFFLRSSFCKSLVNPIESSVTCSNFFFDFW